MKNRVFWIISAACVLAVIGFASFFRAPGSDPKTTAQKFTDNLFKSSKFDRRAIQVTYDQISGDAKKHINTLAALADFAKAKAIPEKGYEIVRVFEKGKNAFVEMRWDYQKKPVIKIFKLVYEDGAWRIDSIQNK